MLKSPASRPGPCWLTPPVNETRSACAVDELEAEIRNQQAAFTPICTLATCQLGARGADVDLEKVMTCSAVSTPATICTPLQRLELRLEATKCTPPRPLSKAPIELAGMRMEHGAVVWSGPSTPDRGKELKELPSACTPVLSRKMWRQHQVLNPTVRFADHIHYGMV